MKTLIRYCIIAVFLTIGTTFSISCQDTDKSDTGMETALLVSDVLAPELFNAHHSGTLRYVHITNDLEQGSEITLSVTVDKTGKMTFEPGALNYSLDYELGPQVRWVEHFNLHFSPRGRYNSSCDCFTVNENTHIEYTIKIYAKDNSGGWEKICEQTLKDTWNGGLKFSYAESTMGGVAMVESVGEYTTFQWGLQLVLLLD